MKNMTEQEQELNGQDTRATTDAIDTRTSSITLKLNAKGGYQWDVKYYFDASVETAEQVALKVDELDAQLKAKFGGQ